MRKKVLITIAIVCGLNVAVIGGGLIADSVGNGIHVQHSNAYYDCLLEYTDRSTSTEGWRNQFTRMCYTGKVAKLEKNRHSHLPMISFFEHPKITSWMSLALFGILALIRLEDKKPKMGPTGLADMLDKKDNGNC